MDPESTTQPAAQTPPQGSQAPPPQTQRDTSLDNAQLPTQNDQQTTNYLPLTPVKRGGLGGIVDEFVDAIAGKSSSQLYTDEQGNKYVQHPDLTRGQKWMRVADAAVSGAAAGWGSKVPGRAADPGRAAAAGLDAGKSIVANQRGRDEKLQGQADQSKIDVFNAVKLKHDLTASEFALSRQNIKATQEDVTFSQQQQDRERQLGSADLGVYKDPAELTKVQQRDPDFWKNVHSNQIVPIPELSPDGQRIGIHVFLRTPGVGGTLVPDNTTVLDFVPGAKPGDEPKLIPRTLASPATHDQVDAWNNSQITKAQQWHDKQVKDADTLSQGKLRDAQTVTQGTEQEKNRAEAAAARARATAIDNALPMNEDGTVDLTRVPPADIQTGRQIASGDQRMQDIVGRGTPAQRKYWMQLAEAIDPTFTGRDFGVRADTQKDFTTGDDSKAITSFNTFLSHAQRVANGVNAMRNGNSPWLNTPVNTLMTKGAGDTRISQAIAPILAARTEFMNFLNNNHALREEDRENATKLLDTSQSPAQLQANIRSLAATAADRLDSVNEKYRRVFKRNFDDMITPETAQTLKNFGLDNYVGRLSTSAPRGQQPQQQGPQTHAWSRAAWTEKNPGKDATAAEAAAKAAGYQVVQ